jgi:uncharacterized protein (TIGR02594 family)
LLIQSDPSFENCRGIPKASSEKFDALQKMGNGASSMRFRTRFMLTVGCVCLLAMSAPALSDPMPKPRPGDQQKRAQTANQTKNAQQKSTMRRAARDGRAARHVSAPLTVESQRPTFGWPALVSEARKYMGTNPTDKTRLWCATFMNMVLAKTGYKGTNSDAAKSFAQYGRRISEPKVGAIAVLTRGKKGGHVGVVSGVDANGNPIIISGNHNKRVGESVYPRSRVIAYVMPSENRTGTTQADRGAAGKPASDGGLDSPIAELIAAIDAEQNRPESSPQGAARQDRPAQAQQQQPAAVVEPGAGRRDLPLDPALAEFLGVKPRGQTAQRVAPQPQPQREIRVEQTSSGRVASDADLAGRLGLPLSR